MTLVLDENQLNQDNIETINKLASSNNIDLNNQETPLTSKIKYIKKLKKKYRQSKSFHR